MRRGFKIYDEPKSPNEGGGLKIYDEPERQMTVQFKIHDEPESLNYGA